MNHYAGVVSIVPHHDRRRILLIRSAKRGGIELPGGTPERGEIPSQTLARELAEETSLRAIVIQRIHAKHDPHGNMILFYAVLASGVPQPGDDALEAFWGDPEQILRGSFPEDYDTVATVLRKIGHEGFGVL